MVFAEPALWGTVLVTGCSTELDSVRLRRNTARLLYFVLSSRVTRHRILSGMYNERKMNVAPREHQASIYIVKRPLQLLLAAVVENVSSRLSSSDRDSEAEATFALSRGETSEFYLIQQACRLIR